MKRKRIAYIAYIQGFHRGYRKSLEKFKKGLDRTKNKQYTKNSNKNVLSNTK